ncbi:TRI5 [Acrasis kona]|uniref:TRI5 n=1 Tax=Acrasis kona TaxID=1008807 RepID=A0AAW2YT46_9EUKA
MVQGQIDVTALIRSFMLNAGYDIATVPIIHSCKSLEQLLIDRVASWNLQDSYTYKMMNKLVAPACAMANMAYNSHPFKAKEMVAVYSLFLLYIDDKSQEMCEQLGMFQYNFLTRSPFGHPILEVFSSFLLEMKSQYGMYAWSAIFTSTIEFIHGCHLETQLLKAEIPTSAKSFPRFLRFKTGASAAFAHLLFCEPMVPSSEFLNKYLMAIPDIIDFIDLGNDVLSFYKESVVGCETDTHFMEEAKVREVDVTSILKMYSSECLKVRSRIPIILGDEKLTSIFETFVNGYIMFHNTQNRYRLNELWCQ